MSKKDQAHAHRWQNRVHNWLIMPQSNPSSGKLRSVTMDELAKHKVSSGSPNKDMWMAVNGFVYDVTRFTQFHPGGVLLMQKYSGMDATVVYAKNHTNVPPDDVIGNYKIGPLVPNPTDDVAPPAAASSSSSSKKESREKEKMPHSSSKSALSSSAATGGGNNLAPPPPPSYNSLTPPPGSTAQSAINPKAINPSTLRYPPVGSTGPDPAYVRQPRKNPTSSPALEEPFEDVVAAARNSRLFDTVPDDQLTAAVLASRNQKRTARDVRDCTSNDQQAAETGMPPEAVIREEEADDIASIECVFDLLDAEAKGSIRMDQLEAFLVNIGGFSDVRSAREAVKETLSGMPSIKATGRITKAQFVEIAQSL